MTEAMNVKAKQTVCVSMLALVLAGALSGCSSRVLKAEDAQEMLKTDEFEQSISIKELPPAEAAQGASAGQSEAQPAPVAPAVTTTEAAKDKTKGKTKNPSAPAASVVSGGKNADKPLVGRRASKAPGGGTSTSTPGTVVAAPVSVPRPPPLEDAAGFQGRRPVVDPYRVGEKVTLEASYFSVVAGDVTLETRPFVEVNGRKSYRFAGTAKSTSVFAMFYAVDDWFETFVDYETLVPYSYSLHVKESKQLRESRTLFDWNTNKALFWDKKINSEKKLEERKQEWDIPTYSQNIFSAVFYLRSFKLEPGKKIAFRLAHENENLIVTSEVVRRERISTPAGEFNTILVKPKIEINGNFKPVGDIFLWLTDDDRKLVVRLETKIKIGKVLAIAKKVEPGS